MSRVLDREHVKGLYNTEYVGRFLRSHRRMYIELIPSAANALAYLGSCRITGQWRSSSATCNMSSTTMSTTGGRVLAHMPEHHKRSLHLSDILDTDREREFELNFQVTWRQRCYLWLTSSFKKRSHQCSIMTKSFRSVFWYKYFPLSHLK